MGPYCFNDFHSAGPMMALSPPRAPHELRTAYSTAAHSHNTFNNSSFNHFNHTNHHTSPQHHFSSYRSSTLSTPTKANPRKRSRDESDIDHEPRHTHTFPPLPPKPAVVEKPIYGEGMTLLNPSTGLAISAESQTGTWYEEKSEAAARATALDNRPAFPSRKSQRLDASAPGPDDITSAVSLSQPEIAPKSSPNDPTVDESTILLGVGWTRLSSDADMQAAARGWAKYIEHHYAIRAPTIMLKSRGLNAYLVSSEEGFYLFKEDLLEGQLVSTTWSGCLRNLRSVPLVFDGLQTLKAQQTPPPEIADQSHGMQTSAIATPNQTISMDLD
ncbi:MAG: hypothetical protein M1834_009535 [Cirrosporium novae-zelandiae]|nr:MAG: hypothetical protein M1834_009535 [Cirrosporium novae-zelandiae]